MSILNNKRTRSQLTLPALNPLTLGRSPLKDARLALRNTSNSQSLANPLPPPSKLRASIMTTEASDADDEILLSLKKQATVAEQSVFKDKKRHSEENDEEAIVERGSKRVKMQVFPSVSAEEGDLQTNDDVALSDVSTHSKGPFDFKPPPRTPQRQLENSSTRAPSIPHIDLKSIVASPWKSASPAKQFEKLLVPQTPRQAGAMEVDRTPSSKGQPMSHPPSTPRPSAPVITVQPETPEAQTSNPLMGNHGMMGPMSPLTPLPPTPAIFGNTIRAFTANKNGPCALGMLGITQQRPEPHRSNLSITTVAKSRSPSPTVTAAPISAPSSPGPSPLRDPSSSRGDLTQATSVTSSSAISVVSKPSSRTRPSGTVVPNGAGSFGPKPKTPSVLKVKTLRGPAPGPKPGGAAGGRVTRSVSMKMATSEDGKADAGEKKGFAFTFKAPGMPASALSAAAGKGKGKAATLTKHGPSSNLKGMKQMSMKDFMAGTSSKPTTNSTSNTSVPSSSSLSNPKSHPISPNKPVSLPNPRPIWNASAGSPTKPRSSSVRPASSLSTLSIALEKLAMPRPIRPNTSLGFAGGEKDKREGVDEHIKDDGAVGMRREGLVALGLGVPSGPKPLKRNATVGDLSPVPRDIPQPAKASAPPPASRNAGTVPRASGASTAKNQGPGSPMKGVLSDSSPSKHQIAKRPSSMFASPVGSTARSEAKSTAGASTSTVKPSSRAFGGHGGLFGMGPGPSRSGIGHGVGKRASKRTSLPSVMASPVKGGDADRGAMAGESDPDPGELTDSNTPHENDGDVSMRSAGDISVVMKDVENEDESLRVHEKERPRDAWKSHASTRASMASHSLTQSLTGVPRTPPKGSMGPPRTPIRAASATYPSTSSTSKDQLQREVRAGAAAETSKTAPSALGRVRRGEDGHVGASRSARIHAQEKDAVVTSGDAGGKVVTPSALSVLNDCVIFVDVRTDGGDDAGGLFVDMLKGMGARILTRVGPSCTHIVYKNGLMSTLTRYRMLKDHKPTVIGIGWVVECVEQRAKVDETAFAVDLDGVNVAGINKRRRSMLPKLIQDESSEPNESQEGESSRADASSDMSDADTSMHSLDGEDLPPLEKARRRRLLLMRGRAK